MSPSEQTQLVVVGAGPGGYAAAFLAADLDMQVTLVDPEPNPGGVCLYRGCIPSKALLHVAHTLSEARRASNWGVDFGEPAIDLERLRGWKEQVVDRLTDGLGKLAQRRNVDFRRGRARFTGANRLTVTDADGAATPLAFAHAILATGSRPVWIPDLSPEISPRVMDSTGALDLTDIPEALLVVGGGYIGLELGTVYAALGSRVTVVEMLPGLLTGADRDLVRFLAKGLDERFDAILTDTRVVSARDADGGVAVTLAGKDDAATERVFDRVLVSVGRRPDTEGLGLEHTRVVIGADGFVETDRCDAHGRPVHLGGGGRGRPAHAGPQGLPSGAGGRGGHCGAPGDLRTGGDPRRGVHRPGGGLVRPDRNRGQGPEPALQGRSVPLGRFGTRADPGPRGRAHQAHRRPGHRTDPGRGHRGHGRWGTDHPGGPGHGNGGRGLGRQVDRPPPSHPVGDPHGSRGSLLRPEHPHVHPQAESMTAALETQHALHFADARKMEAVASGSVDLVVTSPPYPMIEMWDSGVHRPGPEDRPAPDPSKTQRRPGHACTRSWTPCGTRCTGFWSTAASPASTSADATRTVGDHFALYANHARVLSYMQGIGFSVLPAILWRKQTNAPNKFMGSGMMPPGAYVTLEHEYILMFRKGGKRGFPGPAERQNRQESAYFWEERNNWFSDVWMDLKGTRQRLFEEKVRKRSGAFPFELAYRLIHMFSVRGDTVLDPFMGMGTTVLAAMAACRNSVGFERDPNFREVIHQGAAGMVPFANARIHDRLAQHLQFVEDRLAQGKAIKHMNTWYRFPVVTRQEAVLRLHDLTEAGAVGKDGLRAVYAAEPQAEFVDRWDGGGLVAPAAAPQKTGGKPEPPARPGRNRCSIDRQGPFRFRHSLDLISGQGRVPARAARKDGFGGIEDPEPRAGSGGPTGAREPGNPCR